MCLAPDHPKFSINLIISMHKMVAAPFNDDP